MGRSDLSAEKPEDILRLQSSDVESSTDDDVIPLSNKATPTPPLGTRELYFIELTTLLYDVERRWPNKLFTSRQMCTLNVVKRNNPKQLVIVVVVIF